MILLARTATDLIQCSRLTPRLHIHGDDRLGNSLGLGSLLLTVSSETLLTDPDSLGILLLIVRAEQVNIVVVVLSSSTLGGVDGEVARLGAIGRVGLGGVTGEGGELALVAGNVLVPAGGVGVLVGGRGGGESLEDGDISLRGAVAACIVSTLRLEASGQVWQSNRLGWILNQRCISACCFVCRRVLSPPPKHGPIVLIM